MTNLFPIVVSGKYGFVDIDGNVVIDPIYTWADTFRDGMAPVGLDDKYGFVDSTGQTRVAIAYDMVSAFFSEGFAGVREKELWGFVSDQGCGLGNAEYTAVRHFTEGKAAVERGGVWGYIDRCGQNVARHTFAEADFFSCGLARVVREGQVLFLDEDGTARALGSYKDVGQRFMEDRVQVQDSRGLWGFVDKAGNCVVPCQYAGLSSFHESYAVFYEKRKAGFLLRNGDLAFGGSRFDEALDFSDGCAPVRDRGGWYLMQASGDRIGPIACDRLWTFQNGFGRFDAMTKTGFLDVNGKVAIPAQYDNVDDFEYGLARVEFDDKFGYVNTHGKMVWSGRIADIPRHIDRES